MKKIIILSLFIFSSAFGAINKQQILSYVNKGEKDARQCSNYFTKLRKLDKNYESTGVFSSKKTTLQAINLLKEYKGTPEATQNLMHALVRSNNSDYKWLSDNIHKTLVCDPSEYNQFVNKLIRSARKYSLSSSQKRQLAKLILKQFQKELSSPTHPGLIAPYILVLDSLSDLGAISSTGSTVHQKKQLQEMIQKRMAELKEKNERNKEKLQNPVFATQSFIEDVKHNENIRLAFIRYIRSL